MKKELPAIEDVLDILVYDIETCLLEADVFNTGKQIVRHQQLKKGYYYYTHVICITYQWLHEDKPHILTWGKSEADEQKMMKTFDAIIKTSDIVIGKNNNRFDDKHLNTQRLLMGHEPMPSWITKTDDIEKQMRKYLKLPSYTLDYISELLGFGGKIKMDLHDWQAIKAYRSVVLCPTMTSEVTQHYYKKNKTQVIKEGKAAEDKMFEYGLKDSVDTVGVTKKLLRHCKLKINPGAVLGYNACVDCGGSEFIKDGTHARGLTLMQRLKCKTCGSRSNFAPIKVNGSLGKVRKL